MSKHEKIPHGPERLNEEEVIKIIEKMNDSRIDGESDLEHFVVEASDRKIYVPKREKVYINEEWVNIEDHLRDVLDSVK